MSLWTRLLSLFRGHAHAAISSLEDTRIMSEQLKREIAEKIVAAQRAERDLIAQRELCEADYEQSLSEVKRWEANLVKAESQPELIDEVAAKYEDALANSEARKQALDSLNEDLKSVTADVKALEREQTQINNTIANLQAQAQVAKAQTKVANAMGGLDLDGEKNRLQEMQRRVREQQATARATSHVQKRANGSDLESKLNAGSKPSVNELLARAKEAQATKGNLG